jgi:hypothetical protein
VSADLVLELGTALDEAIAAQTRLLGLTNMQREALAAGRGADVERLARELELTVMRAAQVEDRRQRAAAALADAHGVAATRWTALRELVDPAALPLLESRVERLEGLIRELELANAIAGELIRRELSLVDVSMRMLLGDAGGGSAAPLRRYTASGSVAAPPPSRPVLLNTVA